jgi:small conductance mechanosensitive channel
MDSNMTETATATAMHLAEIAVEYGADIVGAIVILIVGWIVAGWARRLTRRAVDRSPHVDSTLKPLIGSIVRYAVLIFTLIAVLAQFGVQTTSIIAVLGAAGLAIGLALQGTLSNISAGMMLLFLRPLKVGEFIDAEGTAGTVDEIGLFTTQMRTFDGVYLSVPNAQLWNRSIKNYSRLPTRRIDVPIGIAYSDDIDAAMKPLQALMEGDDRVLRDPPPEVMVTELGDSAVVLNLRCWTNADNYWGLLFHLNKHSKLALDAAGISIPFPQRDVHLFPSGDAGKAA